MIEQIFSENEVYYDTFYLRFDFSVRNNIDWGAGVPMRGAMFHNSTERKGWHEEKAVTGASIVMDGFLRYSE